jgi:hypothetical protein
MLLVGSNSTGDLLTSIEGALVTANKIIMLGSDVITIYNSHLLTRWNLCLY